MADASENDRANRFEHQCNVMAKRSSTSITQVHSHPFFEADISAFRDLPNARQARLGVESLTVPMLAVSVLVAWQGTGAYDTHVSN